MNCTFTASGHENETCTRRAVVILRWTSQIREGWLLTTERCFCQKHGDALYDVFTRGGVSVEKLKVEEES